MAEDAKGGTVAVKLFWKEKDDASLLPKVQSKKKSLSLKNNFKLT